MAFLDGLLPASWRGIPFFVNSISTKVGRRQAIHEYPQRDTIWVEDLGRGVRSFGFRGYLTGALASIQRDAFLLAVEKQGAGTLSHPTLGFFTCAIVAFASTESDDALGVYYLDMEFVETGVVEYPVSSAASGNAINLGAINMLSASAAAYVSAIGTGAAILSQVQVTVTAWANLPASLATDAAAIGSSVTGLGAAFGRYQGSKAQTAPAGSTPTSLVSGAVLAQTALATTISSAVSGAGSDASATTAALVQAIPGSIVAAVPSAKSQVRVLMAMCSFTSPTLADVSATGQTITAAAAAASALCRQAALAQLALSIAAYAPTSYNAAVDLQSSATVLFDAEILLVSDAGDTATSTALRTLRAAMIAQLSAQGANLAPLGTFTPGVSLPSLVVAQMLYQDASRADDLVAQVDPIHPGFFPGQFLANAY